MIDTKTDISVMLEPGQVTELRAFMPPDARGFVDKFSGMFDDQNELSSTARVLNEQGATGIYFIPNPVNPDLLARSKNRARIIKREPCTTNEDIIRRNWLLLDFDPERPAGISATDEEKELARIRMRNAAKYLQGMGFTEPIVGDSGNGYHLNYRIDLEPDSDLCERVTKAISKRFSDELVKVDESVHNAARIWKVYGTTARKGDDTPERPHRESRLIHVPDEIIVTPRAMLEAVASEFEGSSEKPENTGARTNGTDGPPIEEEIPHVLSYLPDRLDYDQWLVATSGTLDKCEGDVHATESYVKARWPEERAGEYAEKLSNPLTRIGWGSVVNMAKQHGYDPRAYYREWYAKNRPTNGRANGHSLGKPAAEDESVQEGDFWSTDSKEDGTESVKIDQSALIDWLEGQGVCKIYEYDQDTPTKMRRRGLVLQDYPDARIRDLVDKHLRNQSDTRPLAAMRKGRNVFLSSPKLDAVQTIHPIFQRSTKSEAHFYYRNGYVTVTDEDIRVRPYSELQGFIRDEWIQDRSIDLDAGGENWFACEHGRYLQLVTAEDEARTRSVVSAIGYMLHEHKDPANARAVVITEEMVSDDPEGGTGKGLLAQSLGYIATATHIDARRLNLDSQFALQAVQPGVTRIVHFDDAGPRFYFDRLFPAITGSLTVEKKGQQQIIIPFEDSPKFIITTNEVLRGKGGSHERRVFEIEFSSYFNKDHTPEDEFGHLLFHDWDAAEWNRFDRLMLYCVQFYLRHGLVPYEHVNLAWKKFVRNTSKEFGDFVETEGFEANAPGTLALNQVRYDKRQVLARFTNNHRQEITPHKLTSWLGTYAEYMGWDLVNRLGADRHEFAFVDHAAE